MNRKTATLENGFFQVIHDGANITSLRLDATGGGTYGEDVVAAGSAITGTGAPVLKGNVLTFAKAGAIQWAFPFTREGFYDADAHLCYPGTTPTGAVPECLPVRKFVTSNGQTVFIEYFKRHPVGNQPLWLNLAHGNRFFVLGEKELGGNLAVQCPGQTIVRTAVTDTSLVLRWNPTAGPVSVTLLKQKSPPDLDMARPAMAFSPDFTVTYDETGKTVPATPLATDLLRMAMFWHPETMSNGEWVLDGVRTFRFVDTRSTYDDFLRRGLINNLALLGYDRFEHFGMIFNWGQYPDYGAGGLLNVPANNGAYDMRMLHVNAMFIIAVAEYVLSTGDTSILDVRAERYVATDGDQPQPICGGGADTAHHVLAAGDRRLDGKTPEKVFGLGQSFTATAAFTKVTLQLGTGTPLPGAPTEVTAHIWVTRLDDGRVLADVDRPLAPGQARQIVSVDLSETAGPGEYEVRVSDRRSGKYYFGPGITWRTKAEGDYAGAGPFSVPSRARFMTNSKWFSIISTNTPAGRRKTFRTTRTTASTTWRTRNRDAPWFPCRTPTTNAWAGAMTP